MQIREFYPEIVEFTYQDIMEFIYYNRLDYKLREITSNTFWKIEAYFDCFMENKSFVVIFNPDVLSPYRKYNHLDAQSLVDKLDEQFSKVNEIIKCQTQKYSTKM